MADRPWILEHGLVALSASALGLPRRSVDQVIDDVRAFDRDTALVALIRLNLAVTHTRPLDQPALLRLCVPNVADRLQQVMKERGATVIFHEGQILNLIRLVLLFARPGGRRCESQEDFAQLVQLLLYITDFLVERDRSVDPDERAWVFSSFTRAELFMHDEHRVPEALARNYDLFILIPRLLQRRGEHTYDLPGTFAKITGGLGLEDYIGLGFGLMVKYDTIEAAVMGHADIGINRNSYLGDVHLAPEVRDLLWPLVSKPLAAYQDALRAEWDRTAGVARWSAMTTFTQFPIIELANGTMVAVSRRFLRDRITHGIYWIIANRVPSNERQAFTNFFGHVFEAYVRRCLIRGARREFLRAIQYDGADEGRRPEGALVLPRSVAFVEAKARRLLLNVREVGGEAELRAAVEPGLDEAAAQLAAAVDAGTHGAIVGLDTAEVCRYYPVMVTYEPLPSHPFALRLYEDIIYRGGRLRRDQIRPVTLLNTRDIESIEAILWDGGAWPDLLTRKHTPRYADDSFHNYLYRVLKGDIPRSEYLRVRWERIGDMIGTRLFGATMNEAAASGPRLPRRRRRWR